MERLVHHSDRGVQYLSTRYTERLTKAGIATSVGNRGDSYDSSVGTTQAAGPRLGYVVVFRDAVADPGAKTDQLEREHGFASDMRYGHALKGFAAQLSSGQLDRLAADPDVAFISPDATVETVGTVAVVSGDTVPSGVRRVEAGTTANLHQACNINVAVMTPA